MNVHFLHQLFCVLYHWALLCCQQTVVGVLETLVPSPVLMVTVPRHQRTWCVPLMEPGTWVQIHFVHVSN